MQWRSSDVIRNSPCFGSGNLEEQEGNLEIIQNHQAKFYKFVEDTREPPQNKAHEWRRTAKKREVQRKLDILRRKERTQLPALPANANLQGAGRQALLFCGIVARAELPDLMTNAEVACQGVHLNVADALGTARD